MYVPESTQTSQADLCYVKRSSCVFSLQSREKRLDPHAQSSWNSVGFGCATYEHPVLNGKKLLSFWGHREWKRGEGVDFHACVSSLFYLSSLMAGLRILRGAIFAYYVTYISWLLLKDFIHPSLVIIYALSEQSEQCLQAEFQQQQNSQNSKNSKIGNLSIKSQRE